MTIFDKIEYYYRKLNKFLNKPPEALKQNSKQFYYKRLKREWRAVVIIDLITYLFVFAVVKQLAYVFGKADPGWGDYAKAFGFALTEIYMSKAVSRAWMVQQKTTWLWIAMICIMVLIIPLNIVYEWARLAEVHSTPTFTSTMVNKDWLVIMLAIIGSGITGIMILGLSFMRMIQEKIFYETQNGFSNYVKDEERRRGQRDYQASRRALQKKAQRSGGYVYKQKVIR